MTLNKAVREKKKDGLSVSIYVFVTLIVTFLTLALSIYFFRPKLKTSVITEERGEAPSLSPIVLPVRELKK